jgi:hypothetical protein
VEAFSLLSKKTVVEPGLALMMSPLFGLPFNQAITWPVTSKVTQPVELMGTPLCTGAPAAGPPTPDTVASDHEAFAAAISTAPGAVTLFT